MKKLNAYNVYLDGKLVDTVRYMAKSEIDGSDFTADDVRNDLVKFDGYDPAITLEALPAPVD